MEKKEWTQKDGYWEKDGVIFPRVARIKTDKLLKDPELRGFFKPRTFVHYCENFIYKEEISDNEFIYFASVKNVEGDDTACRPIPLGLLEFTSQQKKEIVKATNCPKSAFEKLPTGIHDEAVFDEPFGVELDGVDYLGDDYLDVGSNLGL